jgi:hypothetical protein
VAIAVTAVATLVMQGVGPGETEPDEPEGEEGRGGQPEREVGTDRGVGGDGESCSGGGAEDGHDGEAGVAPDERSVWRERIGHEGAAAHPVDARQHQQPEGEWVQRQPVGATGQQDCEQAAARPAPMMARR